MKEVPVIHCVVFFAIDFEQIGPDIPPERALILVQHARRLRNQLEIDCYLFLEVLFFFSGGLRHGRIKQVGGVRYHKEKQIFSDL